MIEFPHLMQALMAAISLGALVTTIIMGRGKAASERVSAIEHALSDKASAGRMGALENRVDKVEDRTTMLETDMRHLPTRDQAQGLELALRDMKAEMGVLRENLRANTAITERLQEFLLDEARAKRGGA